MDQLAHDFLRQNRLEDAERLYRKMLEQDRNNWVAHLGMARCYLKMYGFPKANPHFQELARLAPAEAAPAHLARAEYLSSQGDARGVARVWFLHAALAYRNKNQMDRCLAVCRRAVELGLKPLEADLENA